MTKHEKDIHDRRKKLHRYWRDVLGLRLPDEHTKRVGWAGNRFTLCFEIVNGELRVSPRTQERVLNVA